MVKSHGRDSQSPAMTPFATNRMDKAMHTRHSALIYLDLKAGATPKMVSLLTNKLTESDVESLSKASFRANFDRDREWVRIDTVLPLTGRG